MLHKKAILKRDSINFQYGKVGNTGGWKKGSVLEVFLSASRIEEDCSGRLLSTRAESCTLLLSVRPKIGVACDEQTDWAGAQCRYIPRYSLKYGRKGV